jgi:hypothetical protein
MINIFHGDVLAFDRMFGGNMRRVGALFSVINEQNKLSANNVRKVDFAQAYALAA